MPFRLGLSRESRSVEDWLYDVTIHLSAVHLVIYNGNSPEPFIDVEGLRGLVEADDRNELLDGGREGVRTRTGEDDMGG